VICRYVAGTDSSHLKGTFWGVLDDHKFKCTLSEEVSDCHTCLRLFVLKYKKDMD